MEQGSEAFVSRVDIFDHFFAGTVRVDIFSVVNLICWALRWKWWALSHLVYKHPKNVVVIDLAHYCFNIFIIGWMVMKAVINGQGHPCVVVGCVLFMGTSTFAGRVITTKGKRV